MNKLVRFLVLVVLAAGLPAFGQTFTVNNLVVNGTSQHTGNLTGTTGVFTGQVSLGGSAGAEALRAVTTASAVNWVQVNGQVTGTAPGISSQGSDTNINLAYSTKGSGSHLFSTGGFARTQFAIADTANAVNYLQVTGGATGSNVSVSAQGSDANIGINYYAKGGGWHSFLTNGVPQVAIVNTPSANRYLTFTGSNGGNPTIGASAGGVAFSTVGGSQFVVADTASAVNYVQATGAATGVSPQLSAQGSDANAGITYIAKGTSGHVFDTNGGTPQFIVSNTTGATRYLTVTGSNGGNPQITTNAGFIGLGVALAPSTTAGIVGTTLADNANAGSVGEVISSSIPVGSAVALTSGTPANITSISLTAGDWQCWGNVVTNPAGTTTQTALTGAISTTSAAFLAAPNGGGSVSLPYSAPAGQGIEVPVGQVRLNVSTTTTAYLVISSTFATSTNAGYGFIGCRRVR